MIYGVLKNDWVKYKKVYFYAKINRNICVSWYEISKMVICWEKRKYGDLCDWLWKGGESDFSRA